MTAAAPLTIPTTCPTCGAEQSHDVRQIKTLALLGRVYLCGAAISIRADGTWFIANSCRQASAIIAELRAAKGQLIAEFRAMHAVCESAAMGTLTPEQAVDLLHDFIVEVLASPLAREALAGNAPASVAPNEPVAPAPAAEAPRELVSGQHGLELSAASDTGMASSLETP